jgi:uncharacterized RDD family membrane protein YckC
MSKEDDKHDHEEHRGPTIETLVTPPVRILPAPLQKRFAGGAIDSVLVTAGWLILLALQGQNPSAFSPANEGYLALIVFLYYFSFEGLFASTPGKSILHLRVVEKSGDQCSFTSSLLRNLLRFIDWLPFLYLLGGAVVLTSKSRLRLGDMLAGTIVTAAPEKDINPPPAPFLFH